MNDGKITGNENQAAGTDKIAPGLTKEQEDYAHMQRTIARIREVQQSGQVAFFTHFDSVCQFHFGADGRGLAHIGNIAKNTPAEILHGKWRLIDEEVNTELKPLLHKIVTNGGSSLEQKAEMLDHIVDSVYVFLGLAVSMGLPFDSAFSIIHNANMRKIVGPGLPKFWEDGKVIKPEGWTAPTQEIFALVLQCYSAVMQQPTNRPEGPIINPSANEAENREESPAVGKEQEKESNVLTLTERPTLVVADDVVPTGDTLGKPA